VSGQTPPFDEIVGADDPERARLRSVHDLLLAAGAPPELPPSLEALPPEPPARVIPLPRRRYTAIVSVAAAAIVLFGIGYAIGGRDSPQKPVRTVAMEGPAGAMASLALLPKDPAGNWPMMLEVSGLAALPEGMTYTLWLTRDGKLAETCGTFAVAAGTTKVPLNAPYPLNEFDGWVVVRTGTMQPFLLTTSAA
jgi:Anti-sigma-K factor rskA